MDDIEPTQNDKLNTNDSTQANYRSTKPDEKNQAQEFLVKPPGISMPKGGGAIKGIGEKFNANPFTGTANFSVPIYVTPGRGGFQPDLTLSYSSGGGNGVFGMGWNLSLPAVTRKTEKKLPQYNDRENTDIFLLAGSEDLVLKTGADGLIENARDNFGNLCQVQRYVPRVEQAFSLIEKWTRKDNSEIHWRTISKDNITALYGDSSLSRITHPTDPNKVFSWLLSEMRDGKGNLIRYEYKAEDSVGLANNSIEDRIVNSNRYIKTILYGNQDPDVFGKKSTNEHIWYFRLEFDYGEHKLEKDPATSNWNYSNQQVWKDRPDAYSNYRPGFELRTRRRCDRVLMFHYFPEITDNAGNIVDAAQEGGEPFLVASTDITFNQYSDEQLYSLIESVTRNGYKKNTDNSYQKESYPEITYEYSIPSPASQLSKLTPQSLRNLPEGLAQGKYQLVDLDGVGVSGIITEQAGHWYYKEGLAADGFGPARALPSKPSPGSLNGGQQLQDLDGDGLLSLVSYATNLQGFFERTDTQSWKGFTNFKSLPNIDWQDPNLQMLDLNGDGYADILISQEHQFIWYPSKARDGFGRPQVWLKPTDEKQGPALVFADISGSIYIADMSGDGQQDIVRIQNGNVCYWPNLGYGRFGEQRIMANPPLFDTNDLFNANQLRLVDIDGTGTTDLLYLNGSESNYWLNLSGNQFSQKKNINAFPASNNTTSVQVADIQADGTASLVWSSSLPADSENPLKYVSLMTTRQRTWNNSIQDYQQHTIVAKPYLLIAMENGMGGRTEIQYKPSSFYYLQDKQKGFKWQTRLPMTVQLVDSVKTIDLISNTTYQNKYNYHHGYYDGIEREFRGFACVDQIDIDDFEQNNKLDQAPVLTKTWYHTGAWLESTQLENYFKAFEYYQDDKEIGLLPDSVLKKPLLFTEEREAMRVLKGSVLHQEVYALETDTAGNRTTASQQPYSVSEQSYQVIRLQEKGTNPYSVFTLQPQETISYNYERDINTVKDPRISHQLNLEFDEYNNITRSAAVAYPRREQFQISEYNLEQNQFRITYSQTAVSHSLTLQSDYQSGEVRYRHSVPYESKSWELGNFDFAKNKVRLSDLPQTDTDFSAINEISFFTQLNGTEGQQRRLLSHTQNYYWNDQLTTVLEFGKVESQAMPHHAEQLANNEVILQNALKSKFSVAEINSLIDELTSNAGRYINKENAETQVRELWQSSGTQYFDASQYFLPSRVVDVFDNETVIEVYWRNLFPTRIRDPLNNRVSIDKINPYYLLPTRSTDANNNTDDIRYDILGQVIATARYGQQYNPESQTVSLVGTTLDALPELPNLALTLFDDNTIDIPTLVTTALHFASSRIVVDYGRFKRERKPIAVLAVMREQFSTQDTINNSDKVQIAIAYQDGMGRELVAKIRVNDGLAKQLDSNGDIQEVNATPRWLASGRALYNNKGNPVKQYEPYYSNSHHYIKEDELLWGVSSTQYYDPLDRVIRTELPDGSYSKTEFTPWWQKVYDQNDTIADSDWYNTQINLPIISNPQTEAEKLNNKLNSAKKRAATLALQHNNTPAQTFTDNLSRAFIVIENNGLDDTGVDVLYKTKTIQDIVGNGLAIINAKGYTIITSDYDYLGNNLHDNSVDSGESCAVINAAALPLYGWDGKNTRSRIEYAIALRPSAIFSQEQNKPEKCLQYTVYGEQLDFVEAQAKNLLGLSVLVTDGAGSVRTIAIDILGNPLEGQRQIIKLDQDLSYNPNNSVENQIDIQMDWTSIINSDLNNVEVALKNLLRPEIFTTKLSYDGLGRALTTTYQHQLNSNATARQVGKQESTYNKAGQLLTVTAFDHNNKAIDSLPTDTPDKVTTIQKITYNEKGQRLEVVYKNGVVTNYQYDDDTYRLTNLSSIRLNSAATDKIAQDLYYLYDPVGNITQIYDHSQQNIYFSNNVATPDNTYQYDALYRLTNATGREHAGNNAIAREQAASATDSTRVGQAQPNNAAAIVTYNETYAYDKVGNILKVTHGTNKTNDKGWTRDYEYLDASQLIAGEYSHRLTKTILKTPNSNGNFTDDYQHDENGNMIKFNPLSVVRWNVLNELQASSKQVINNGDTPETSYYLYDSSGERVLKTTFKKTVSGSKPTRINERLYLGGFEIYREFNTDGQTTTLERDTVSIMDDSGKFMLFETKRKDTTPNPNNDNTTVDTPISRYQFSNHLGSASLELDKNAKVISYEEYFPYGATSYHAQDKNITSVSKRYRYTGKEKDDETGLYYYGARYYMAWLGRWCSADPAGFVDGGNIYMYVSNNPIMFNDPTGLGRKEQDLGARTEKASKDHQVAANKRRAQIKGRDLGEVEVDYQKRVGDRGKGSRIPDEVKKAPGGAKKVVELKGNHINSERVSTSSKRQSIFKANLNQVRTQLEKLQEAGRIGSSVTGSAVHVIHDNNDGVSSRKALKEWRNDSKLARQQWIDEATDPAEKALRKRTRIIVTTRDKYATATKKLADSVEAGGKKKGRAGGLVGKIIGVGLAAYVLYDTGDAYAAGQVLNPIPETTNSLFSDGSTIVGFAEAIGKDAWNLTLISTAKWATDSLGPKGRSFRYDPILKANAILDGRNPFCAQCHGKGGALDPNNVWNQQNQ